MSPTPARITRRNYINRLGTWNLREINGTAKMEEVVDAFREGKLVACFNGDEIEMGWRGIMVWSK